MIFTLFVSISIESHLGFEFFTFTGYEKNIKNNSLSRPQVEFATDVFQLVTSFNGLSLTDTEVGLFAAIVLLTPDRPGVSDVKTVQHSQDRIVEAFKLQVSYIN